MKIVFLDALTIGADLDFKLLEKEGELIIYQTSLKEDLAERIKDAEIIITNKVLIGKNEFEKAQNLKLICVAATGYNNIDIEEAKKRNIIVANVKNYSTEAVVQHTLSLILALQNSIVEFANESKSGNWSKSPIFTMLNHTFVDLKGKNLGIIGFGTIGKRVAEIAKAFGMNVLVGKRKGINYNNDDRVEFEELIKRSDVISIHAPLSENTLNLFTENEFKKMKNDAIIINTARGGILNEKDLYNALKNKEIRAAAIDVAENEPINIDNPLLKLDNIIITPHIAWTSKDSRIRLLKGIVENIKMYKDGRGNEIMV
ncbi:MAG: D-2-hydroxyacid dehydrogenase [Bacteroidales bacterium]|nr:D-2-hydroxyacid dehydrogenase [Bacteroidales bacterium]